MSTHEHPLSDPDFDLWFEMHAKDWLYDDQEGFDIGVVSEDGVWNEHCVRTIARAAWDEAKHNNKENERV